MIEDLINALENYQEAKKDLDQKSKKCEYDRSYFLSDEIDEVKKYKNELTDLFKKTVIEIIEEKLNK